MKLTVEVDLDYLREDGSLEEGVQEMRMLHLLTSTGRDLELISTL